ncbi:MAG: laminin G domain-containing protein, partial [Mangrovibacterium sp.]|nr:laminin G domain-containing protein [Mangrovibacterium sp.]
MKRNTLLMMTVAATLFCLWGMTGEPDGTIRAPHKAAGKKPKKESASKQYSWESAMAKATATGDLLWAPHPFVFETGDVVRYIDFEGGDDQHTGMSKADAWKHHPWDKAATGNAAKWKGICTYVFKKGSVYRGTIQVRESGEPGNPVRFTADPSWGEGEAAIYGSVRITDGWKKGADHPDIPDAANVWFRDLDFAPRTLWMLRGGEVTRIPIARMPDWKISDPEDVKSEWWPWDYQGSRQYFHVTMKNEEGKELVLGIDTKNLTGPKELYLGAVAWTEFGWVDGTPYPSYVQGFDAEKKGIGFEGYLGSAKSRFIARHHRYYLEDKPHYLDDPDGEYWFDKKGEGGRLYVRLPQNTDPNSVILEAGKETTLVQIEEKDHISISGLSFRFTNVSWNLTELPWGKEFALKEHLYPACIRVWGGGRSITVANCTFAHVNEAVYMKAVKPGFHLDRIAVTDNEIWDTDHGGISVEDGILWGFDMPDDAGHLFDVRILRNQVSRTGQRPQRVGSSNAVNVICGQTVEIAGNIIETPWHAGVNVFGGKLGGNLGDVPLSRILIYQNKVTDGIRTGDDCGNIETWQGGVAYVYNNVSGNPGGFRNASWMDGKDNPDKPGSARFGMAYYLDGAFKNYYFNNIGWGLSKDPWSKMGATTMFQEIISYQNTFFNNTAYNFVKGSRRQAPQAGSNKYLGNIWDGIGDWVFWHTVPARSPIAGNEQDAGPQKGHYALETNAFSGNVFHDITGKYASFKPSGQWHETFEEARDVLRETQAIASDLGVVASLPPMKNPAKHDFSLAENSAATDMGAKVFVPWSLYAMVGEWNFYPAGDDPAKILDEHWYMTPYYVTRGDYYQKPMFHLRGVNIEKEDYVAGPLEDWTNGALRFNGLDQYAVCADSLLNKPFDYTVNFRWNRQGRKETYRVAGRDLKSPEIYDSNFLVEIYFKTDPGVTGGVLVKKMDTAGYSLEVNQRGGITFTIKGGGETARLESKARINDGRWHHVIAEADRASGRLTLYINGREDRRGSAIEQGIPLSNQGDLFVGGTPSGNYFKGTLDFLRIGLGTLADSRTDIDELVAWQFRGPFLKDFAGNEPAGKRDAGALEK